MEPKFNIVRYYVAGNTHRTLERNVRLKQAQSRVWNPEASSQTCCKSGNKLRTKKVGEWFDGYCPS